MYTLELQKSLNSQILWEELKRRYLPLKYAYTREEAILDEDTFEDEETTNFYQETAYFESNMLFEGIQALYDIKQIVEIGPGNGRHSTVFLNEASERQWSPDRYLAMDYSTQLLSICAERLSNFSPSMGVYTAQWDIENESTQQINQWRLTGPTVIIALGNTLGNVEDSRKTLSNVRSSANQGDWLLLGVLSVGSESPQAILARYLSDTFRTIVLRPLEAIGIDISSGIFRLSYSDMTHTVIGSYETKEDFSVHYQGDMIYFSTGDQLRCFISRRFEHDEMMNLLCESGWALELYVNVNGSGIYLARCENTYSTL